MAHCLRFMMSQLAPSLLVMETISVNYLCAEGIVSDPFLFSPYHSLSLTFEKFFEKLSDMVRGAR